MARHDNIGLFWQDIKETGKRAAVARIMPDIPETGWEAPTEYPNLRAAKVIAVDVETWDPYLKDKGPGWARNEGHIVGASIGTEDGYRWYFPIRHTIEPETNLDPTHTLNWLNDTLCNNQPKVGANLMYDVGWLNHEGVEVNGDFIDVSIAEALLNEASMVNLDDLGKKYLGIGKTSNSLYQWCSEYYGGDPNGTQRKNIWRAPPCLVGHYAESDVDLPLRIIEQQYPLLVTEGLLDLFLMECRLIPLIIEMRFEGVTVDVNKAEQLHERFNKEAKILRQDLKSQIGFEVNVNSRADLAKMFDKLGLPYKKTAKGNPSFTGDFLESVNHPAPNLIKQIKKIEKINGTFIKSYILNNHIEGKVYGQFHLVRGEDFGTRSGRFSSSNPDLQNIPSRDKELAPLVRGLFRPDYNHPQWRRYDYSQIEYRCLAHFAVGEGADQIREEYRNNPNIDYHVLAQKLIYEITGIMLGRKPTKTFNFGIVYGMGIAKLAIDLGLALNKARELSNAYHQGMPFVKGTMDACMQEAQETGVITTILGRKSRFDLWEPAGRGVYAPPLPYEKAILYYGSIKRAYTYKALNRKLQGSAADILKKAMLQCYEDGIFTETGVPRLTVHDELDFSDPGGRDKAFKEMKYIMETALPLNVPIIVDTEIGSNWGKLQKVD